MYLYFRILNSEDEEIFDNEEHGCASKKRKKDHGRNDTNAQCKVVSMACYCRGCRRDRLLPQGWRGTRVWGVARGLCRSAVVVGKTCQTAEGGRAPGRAHVAEWLQSRVRSSLHSHAASGVDMETLRSEVGGREGVPGPHSAWGAAEPARDVLASSVYWGRSGPGENGHRDPWSCGIWVTWKNLFKSNTI